jgi:hydroxymethylbilane synthase
LLEGRADLAVHSLKDLPTELPAGLTLAAVPEREDPRDALVGLRLAEIPQGARVGTSSLRRAAQLKRARPDLVLEPIRGNLDTRIRKLDEGQFASIVLACAGLKRLGWDNRIAETIDPDVICPAVGQGALAIETRAGEEGTVLPLEHSDSRVAVTGERAVLEALGGGCQVPIGAYARVSDGRIHLTAVVISPDGSTSVREHIEGASRDAEPLGRELGARLLAAGGHSILQAVYGRDPGI